MKSLLEIARDLAANRHTSEQLTAEALERIDDPAGEGARAFTKVYREAAREQARAADRARALGIVPSVLAGIPISIKDLFDVRGEPTLAGSIVLKDAPSAASDADVIARLRAAGTIIIGRTNMTEFAFSGLGLNPHYGTPKNPYDRETGRIPGGSSSGAAVSVTDGMAMMGLGTDTGGSVRIPAAFCGLVGFKPTARRISRRGVLPLSSTLDSVGPLAPTVACCALVDAVLANESPNVPAPLPLAGLRIGVVRDLVMDDIEAPVAEAIGRALERLSASGARVVDVAFPELRRLKDINAKGGFSAPEAFAWHRPLLALGEAKYDPRVAKRILSGEAMSAADYIELAHEREAFIARACELAAPYDVLVWPTLPIIAPPIAELEASEDAYWRANALALRNPSIVNFIDGCALSLPCHRHGEAPVGLMLAGMAGDDRRLLAIGQAVESALGHRAP